MSSSRTTTAFMPILKRSFHASTSRRSHIGSLPITLPQSVTLSLPPTSISPTLPPSSPLAQRLVTVTGPLGTQTLPILPPIILSNNGQGLSVSVHDSEEKSQRSLWGLTRSLINNAIKGVSEGYKVDLRLVGVGYRGAVEPIPKVFLDLQSQMPRIARPSKPGAPPYVLPPLPTERLNMKLGYAHPVLIDIPAGITVTTPAPTKIVLSGTDKQKLGLFAAKIRRWRKPEPYRGKVSHVYTDCDLLLTTIGYLRRRRDNQAQGDQEEVVDMHTSPLRLR
jgi:large subunit ribosomal protein L6